MTDDYALEWLNGYAAGEMVPPSREAARTLKAMLARPVLPETPPADAFEAMRAQVPGRGAATTQIIYDALYAHLTAPKTKTVWRVIEPALPDSIDYVSLEDALGRAKVVVERHRQSVTIEPVEVPA